MKCTLKTIKILFTLTYFRFLPQPLHHGERLQPTTTTLGEPVVFVSIHLINKSNVNNQASHLATFQ